MARSSRVKPSLGAVPTPVAAGQHVARRWRSGLDLARGLTVALTALAVLALIGYPFGRLGWDAIMSGGATWRAVLSVATTRIALMNTLIASTLAALNAIVLGAAFAFATERLPTPGRGALRVALLLPVLIPPFIAAFGWTQAYGPAGWLDKAIGLQMPGLFGSAGVTMLLAVHGLPFVYLNGIAALGARGAQEMEQAARSSGASAWTATRTVTLPLLRPSLLAGGSLAFLSAASDFGIPAFVGTPGRFPMLTTEIYRRLTLSSSPGSFAAATVLATLLAIVALALLAAMARVGRSVVVEAGRGQTRALRRTGPVDVVIAAGCWLFVIVASGLPLMALVLVALTRAYGLPLTPDNWTLANVAAVLATPRLATALGRTVVLAAIAASLALVLGGLATAARSTTPGRALGVIIALPFAVPGSTVAVAVIIAFTRPFYGTFALLLIAWLARYWVLAERSVGGAYAQVGQEGVRAARASGAGAVRAVWDAVLPALRPALGAAWLLVFLNVFHELTMSSLLYGPRTQTIAVIVLDTQQAGQIPVTAAIAVLLTAVVCVGIAPLVLSPRLARFVRFGR